MSGVLERIATALEVIAANMGGEKPAGSGVSDRTETKPAPKAEKAAAPKAEKAAAPKAEKSKSGVTVEQMQAALIEVKDAFGVPETKKLYTVHGYDAMKDIAEEHYEAIYKAAKAKLSGADAGSDEDDGL